MTWQLFNEYIANAACLYMGWRIGGGLIYLWGKRPWKK